MIDLLGGVPAEGDLWVRAQVDRPGKQIELVSAEMLAPGPRRRTPTGGAGQRLAVGDARHLRRRARARAAAAPAGRCRQPRHGEGLGPQLRPQPRLALADHADGRRPRRIVAAPDRRPGQGRDDDAAAAAVHRRRRRQRHRHQAGHPQVDVHEHRPRGARAPRARGRVDRHPRRDQLRTRRHRHHVRHAVRRERRRSAASSSRCWCVRFRRATVEARSSVRQAKCGGRALRDGLPHPHPGRTPAARRRGSARCRRPAPRTRPRRSIRRSRGRCTCRGRLPPSWCPITVTRPPQAVA